MTSFKAGRPSEGKPLQSLSDFAQQEKTETKKYSLDLTLEEHYKLKMHSFKTGKTIAQILRAFIDTLPNY